MAEGTDLTEQEKNGECLNGSANQDTGVGVNQDIEEILPRKFQFEPHKGNSPCPASSADSGIGAEEEDVVRLSELGGSGSISPEMRKSWSVSSTGSVDVVDAGGVTDPSAAATPPDSSDSSRRHSKSQSLPHGVKLCPEKPVESSGAAAAAGSGTEAKWVNLEEELRKAQIELKAKDHEVEELKGIREQVEAELHDLTASLFVEAHKMVKEAKMKEISSEKSLRETQMQLDGLQAEVAALKALLITSTPSRPNLGGNGGNGISLFKKQHKRTPSHNHLQYGRADDETDGDGKEKDKQNKCTEVSIDRDTCELDPLFHKLFADWRNDPTLSKDKAPFLQKVYAEDIEPCLSFVNADLVKRLRVAVEENSIWVEPLPEKEKSRVPKDCALIGVPRICNYRMRFAFDSDEWFDISQLCRDRIAAVCEFLNYLRYIKNGLVKASVDGAYWEIIRLRKQMALAKLGVSQ